ncbi:MAG TPA: hypothetical protein VG871_04865 [Vicinamibacterales bacterium]|nr:hypothetical protein [Vicinamibacterales bacterium]
MAKSLADELVPTDRHAPDGDTRERVAVATSFTTARTKLQQERPALLVTALRLGRYNGLHLVYLCAAANLPTKSVVHTDTVDPAQAREVRSAGAFYEIRPRLPIVLPAYASSVLPSRDRREAVHFDRRRYFRGGRRVADQHVQL